MIDLYKKSAPRIFLRVIQSASSKTLPESYDGYGEPGRFDPVRLHEVRAPLSFQFSIRPACGITIRPLSALFDGEGRLDVPGPEPTVVTSAANGCSEPV